MPSLLLRGVFPKIGGGFGEAWGCCGIWWFCGCAIGAGFLIEKAGLSLDAGYHAMIGWAARC